MKQGSIANEKTNCLSVNIKERDHLKDLCVDGTVVLK
jgi:hypothetical protein